MPHRGHNFDRLRPSAAHRCDHRREGTREITRAQKNHAPRWSCGWQRCLVTTDRTLTDGHTPINPIILPPLVSIRLQRLKVVICQNAKHRTRIKRALANRVQRNKNGHTGRQLQRLNNAGSRIAAEREELAGDLPSIERINGQQVDESPCDVYIQQVQND